MSEVGGIKSCVLTKRPRQPVYAFAIETAFFFTPRTDTTADEKVCEFRNGPNLVSSHSNTMDALADDLKNKATLTKGAAEKTTKEAGTDVIDKKSKTKASVEGKLDVLVGELP